MNDLRKAAGEALEALEDVPYMSNKDDYERLERVKTALRQALETNQEPFEYWSVAEGWVKIDELREHFDAVGCGTIYKSAGEGRSPLYTAPPKREWVGLTDEEIDALSQAPSLTDELMDCVDRLGSEADTVDPRVWQHLLVYAPKPEEEPVAWITNGGKGELWWHRSSKFDEEGNLIGPNQDDIPLYTAPPKQWVGLTDAEKSDLWCESTGRDSVNEDTHVFADAIEAKLREKNNG